MPKELLLGRVWSSPRLPQHRLWSTLPPWKVKSKDTHIHGGFQNHKPHATEHAGPDLSFTVQVCLQLLLHYYSYRHAKLCGKSFIFQKIMCNATTNSWLTHLLSFCLCLTRCLSNIHKMERESGTLQLRFPVLDELQLGFSKEMVSECNPECLLWHLNQNVFQV